MTQLSIVSGIYGARTPDWLRSYPHNMMVVGIQTGISGGYLRTSYGTSFADDGPGTDGGGTVWNNTHYRTMGGTLVSVDPAGSVSAIGGLPSAGASSFASSFDRLAVAIGGTLSYLKDGAVVEVTDPDLGTVLDVIWIDGRFMTTDGTSLVVTELLDPTSVDPLKYGSSEADPDPITGLLAVRGEAVALNRYSIEFFIDTGSTGFPFQRQRGAQIDKGCVSAGAKCLWQDSFAFVGNGYEEAPRVYVATSGQAQAISPPELDRELSALTESELVTVRVEARDLAEASELMIHLPAKTWVFNQTASAALQQPVWTTLGGDAGYRARNWTYAHAQWWAGDAQGMSVGLLDRENTVTFGDIDPYAFAPALTYNMGNPVIVHNLELVGQYGRASEGQEEPSITMQWSDDGLTYGTPRSVRLGRAGERRQRVAWRRIGRFRNWRGFRFTGRSAVPVSFSRLETLMEPLGG